MIRAMVQGGQKVSAMPVTRVKWGWDAGDPVLHFFQRGDASSNYFTKIHVKRRFICLLTETIL